MKLSFKIKQVKPKIFLFEFIDQYNMCMHFLRYQEYYESPNPKFRNKSFTIFEFMEWQSKKEGNGNFTYPTAWSGFNLPSEIMTSCIHYIEDENKYDEAMFYAYDHICCDVLNGPNDKFYIIGAMKGNSKTLNHECAHGMFYLDKNYKKEMTKLVKALPTKIRKNMETMLIKLGYVKQVFIDEIQAYFSTQDNTEKYLINSGIKMNDKEIKKLKKLQVPFKDVFKKYN